MVRWIYLHFMYVYMYILLALPSALGVWSMTLVHGCRSIIIIMNVAGHQQTKKSILEQ